MSRTGLSQEMTMKKANANDAAINSKTFGPIGNVVTVDDQVLTLLDQLVAMKLLVGWEDRAPSQRHYTIGKRLRDIAQKISSAATTHPIA
ncbi:hypothetical protein XH97_00230 [Bradyrhizobium sp. CCBAU 53380]|nr:hypothetical protein [Bradyrhizobium sp. CCBAU 53380]